MRPWSVPIAPSPPWYDAVRSAVVQGGVPAACAGRPTTAPPTASARPAPAPRRREVDVTMAGPPVDRDRRWSAVTGVTWSRSRKVAGPDTLGAARCRFAAHDAHRVAWTLGALRRALLFDRSSAPPLRGR